MGFTHIDENGSAVMVDVGGKEATHRAAAAAGRIRMSGACYAAVAEGRAKKGDVLGVARVAGIMAAKRTAEIIPLCHTLCLTRCAVEFNLIAGEQAVEVLCTVECDGKTGVEMEALTGASAALLTVYDMCKSMDKAMVIDGIHLLEKRGGKSGDFAFPGGRP